MKNRKFKALCIGIIVLFVLAVLTIFKLPDVWPFVAGAFVAGIVGLITTYFTGNVTHSALKSKFFRKELQEDNQDENS